MSDRRPVLVIHGGAGTIAQGQADAGAAHYHAALAGILAAGADCLARGGSALDVVGLAVDLLEECPLFNAGHGAVFTSAGTHELDAAVMDGATLRAGAVASVTRVRRPGRAARAVMDGGEHVLIAGGGADAFAEGRGLEMVEPDFFSTDARRDQLHRAQAAGKVALDHDVASGPLDETRKFGTIGAVALDRNGHLAAMTSTGGMTNKRPGRVGDSPLIGAGTYADDRTAAVSCTGTGEAFIRIAAAHDVCARMAYGGQDLETAARAVVHEALAAVGGRGGLIAVDAHGQVAMPFNTEGMYRGLVHPGETPVTAIFSDSRHISPPLR
ncbi:MULTISPECIES: isoaspartyl peptidase/L-asparaginase [unclassified Methylobacterium]|uniref:isoaspartyl peptidase/L-asparaginase family protein n=1 Tax=unclassified Methylobacterium TaxID=2615210 RepID=UPI0011C1DEA2|nr:MULTISPECIES: isoaspartyl peptidase/L-asparaginase [unclassified Methylobacterium]QEE39111.1 isoaspartyl peptidase/L-asparaginase [Methylobacterium sp. WL1]TXN01774.1 isoaspartyl peptidase/L-asparaginase [Methylobacterium sp. WL64]TXN53736.1 isoaspartyl peptidase/L-asparaginase [Methylobacterium sp. WL2]